VFSFHSASGPKGLDVDWETGAVIGTGIGKPDHGTFILLSNRLRSSSSGSIYRPSHDRPVSEEKKEEIYRIRRDLGYGVQLTLRDGLPESTKSALRLQIQSAMKVRTHLEQRRRSASSLRDVNDLGTNLNTMRRAGFVRGKIAQIVKDPETTAASAERALWCRLLCTQGYYEASTSPNVSRCRHLQSNCDLCQLERHVGLVEGFIISLCDSRRHPNALSAEAASSSLDP